MAERKINVYTVLFHALCCFDDGVVVYRVLSLIRVVE
jgi:hypothetical protein